MTYLTTWGTHSRKMAHSVSLYISRVETSKQRRRQSTGTRGLLLRGGEGTGGERKRKGGTGKGREGRKGKGKGKRIITPVFDLASTWD